MHRCRTGGGFRRRENDRTCTLAESRLFQASLHKVSLTLRRKLTCRRAQIPTRQPPSETMRWTWNRLYPQRAISSPRYLPPPLPSPRSSTRQFAAALGPPRFRTARLVQLREQRFLSPRFSQKRILLPRRHGASEAQGSAQRRETAQEDLDGGIAHRSPFPGSSRLCQSLPEA